MKHYGIYDEAYLCWYTGETAKGLYEPLFAYGHEKAARYPTEAAAKSTLSMIDSFTKMSDEVVVREIPANEDTILLDHLETMAVRQIEGQCRECPEGEHVGNSWTVEGPFSTVREALRELASEASRVKE